MNIRHLHVFNIVCQCGNMTEAAGRLGISEPAVSRYMRELETELGVTLFIRKKPLVLTEYGEELLRRSEIIEKQVNDIAAVFNPQTTFEKWLRIGLVSSIADPFITKFADRSPQIFNANKEDLHFFVYAAEKLLQMLREDQLDYIVSDIYVPSDDFSTYSIYTDTMAVVCAPNAAYPEMMTIADIAKLPLLLRNPGSGNRASVDAAFSQNGLVPRVYLESESNYCLLRMAHRNFGLTFLSSALCLREIEENYVREIKISDFSFSRTFYLCCHKYRNGSDTAARIRTAINDLVLETPEQIRH